MKSTCTSCWEIFTSETSFDKHRTGDFDHYGKVGHSPRRCFSPDEMREKGMTLSNGMWVTRLRELSTIQ